MRGLKCQCIQCHRFLIFVAPLMGAWIEIEKWRTKPTEALVAPLMGICFMFFTPLQLPRHDLGIGAACFLFFIFKLFILFFEIGSFYFVILIC